VRHAGHHLHPWSDVQAFSPAPESLQPGARFSFPRLFFCRLPKANAGASAVFVDEFDAGVLESTPNDIEGGAARLGRSRLKLMDRDLAYTRGRCEILLAPFEKTPRCPAL
jgi:hypothetical protein